VVISFLTLFPSKSTKWQGGDFRPVTAMQLSIDWSGLEKSQPRFAEHAMRQTGDFWLKKKFPLAIPIVGNTTIGDHQSPSIAVFDSGSNASLVTALPTSALGIGASITFSCQTPSREVTLAYLMIERVTGLPAHGRILGWTEKDVAPEFIY
jgi:hypothetical protein